MTNLMIRLLIFTAVLCQPLALFAKSAPVVCIGKGDDPSKNFYGEKLDGIIEYMKNAESQLAKLKARNIQIDNSISQIRGSDAPGAREKKVDGKAVAWGGIPSLRQRYEASAGKVDNALDREDMLRDASYEKTKSELLRIQNASDKAARDAHRTTFIEIGKRESALESVHKRIIAANTSESNRVRSDIEVLDQKYEQENKILVDRHALITKNMRSPEVYEHFLYQERVIALHRARDAELAPLNDRMRDVRRNPKMGTLSIENEIRRIKKKFEDAEAILLSEYRVNADKLISKPIPANYYENMRAAEDSKHKKLLDDLNAREKADRKRLESKLEQLRQESSKEDQSYQSSLEGLEGERKAATEKLQKLFEESRRKYRASANAEGRRHQQQLSRYRGALNNARGNILLDIADLEQKLLDLEQEKEHNTYGKPHPNISDEEYKNNPEKYFDYQGIQDLERNIEKFKFIAQWWKEQGSKMGTVADTEALAFQCYADCDKTPLRIPYLNRPPHISKQCIDSSIRFKKAHTDEVMCNDSGSSAGATNNLCVTPRMADYTQWSLNKALDCLGGSDPIDPQVLFRKLNNESTFRFFHSYNGGQGLMQTITCAQDEVFGLSPSPYCGASNVVTQYRSMARKELAQAMNSNPKKCQQYSSIINFEQEARYDRLAERARGNNDPKKDAALAAARESYPKFNQRLFNVGQSSDCDFVSIQDGIQRNIISGMGLYLNYRNLADNDLAELLGKNIKNHPQFKKIRDLTALVYYGPTGPGGAKIELAKLAPTIKRLLDQTKAKVAAGKITQQEADKLIPDAYERILRDKFKYIRAIQKSEDAVNSHLNTEDLQCSE